MTYERIIYEKKDHVAYITINRPEVMNALDHQSSVEMIDAFDDFKDDPESWIAVLTGAGDRAFCAGNDLKATARTTAGGGRPDARTRFGGITSGFDCPKPIIAAVNGVALGGGFEIALACDLVIAAENARFGLPEPRVGVFAGSGGIHRLARQVPFKQAMGLLLTGRTISAADAQAMGLINELVPPGQALAAAQRWAAEILECSPLSVQLTKEAAYDGAMRTVDEAIVRDQDLRILPRLFTSEDFVEGPRAFAEKRKPVWKGR